MEQTKTERTRLDYVDIAKCLALVLVAYSHTPHCWGQVWLGSFFIAVFFLLSGYTSGMRDSWREHTMKRLRRLLIPYFLFSVVMVVGARNFEAHDIWGVLYSRYGLYPGDGLRRLVFLRSCNAPLWFLTAMFVADQIHFLTIRLSRRYDGSTCFPLLVVVAFLTVTWLMSRLPILLPWSLDSAFLFALFMYMGHLARRWQFFRPSSWVVSLLVLLVFVGSCTLNGAINLSVRHYGASLLLCVASGLAGSYLLIQLCQKLETWSFRQPLVSLGRKTLVIFSLQMLVIHFDRVALQALGYAPTGWFSQLVVGMTMVVTVFFVGWLASIVLHRLLPSVF